MKAKREAQKGESAGNKEDAPADILAADDDDDVIF
jgi:hypothetical protein